MFKKLERRLKKTLLIQNILKPYGERDIDLIHNRSTIIGKKVSMPLYQYDYL